MAATSDLARGIAQQLKTWVPILPTILPRMPQPMAAALRTLCDRAAAISPDSTDDELAGVWEAFIDFTRHQGMQILVTGPELNTVR
jgi:hypothetical protein